MASYIYTNYCNNSPDCYCSQTYYHGYAKLSSAWSNIDQWLDPLNTNQYTLDGIALQLISEKMRISYFLSNGLLTNSNMRDAVINNDGSFSFIYNIFKGNSGINESNRLGLPLLGQIPLDDKLSQSCDAGIPYMINNEDSIVHSEFVKIANAIF